jgi:lipopolysaccharide biosynthesis glycosyltransferase
MTQFDSIVYLDSDTVVLNDLSHLHELVSEPWRTGFEFAAATDNWFGTYIYKFNAGVLVLHPSRLVFNELIRTYTIPGNYHPKMAEQEFLNQFYRHRYLQLPTIYNMNMAVYPSKKYLWEKLRPDFKIVHFTIRKPFMSNGKNTEEYKGVYDLYDEVYKDFIQNTNISLIRTFCHMII